MSKRDELRLIDVQEIRDAAAVKTIGEWKRVLKEKAVKFGLTDREVIDIANGRI